MWFVGQYLRTAKDIRDSSSYSDIQIGINELRDSIKNLQTLKVATPDTTAPPTVSNTMLNEANKAISNGFVLAGLMQAGVAFEQAVIESAKRKQIVIDDRTTTSQLINKLKVFYGDGIVKELFAVWKLRNQLVHLSPEASKEIKARPELMKYFEWAIRQLEN
jgi:hypothetical protein